ncbi:DUF6783 domain-containing protein [Ruminococcus sp. RTP21358st1_A5_RTP21358_211008]
MFEKSSRNPHVPLCGIFCPNSFVAARKKGTIFPFQEIQYLLQK